MDLLVKLVRAVNSKMRGFDLKETINYYLEQLDQEISQVTDWKIPVMVQELIGDVEKFNLHVASKTNPIPAAPIFAEVPEYLKIKTAGSSSFGSAYIGRRGSGGGSCACACAGCACAGCACACAGGGR